MFIIQGNSILKRIILTVSRCIFPSVKVVKYDCRMEVIAFWLPYFCSDIHEFISQKMLVLDTQIQFQSEVLYRN